MSNVNCFELRKFCLRQVIFHYWCIVLQICWDTNFREHISNPGAAVAVPSPASGLPVAVGISPKEIWKEYSRKVILVSDASGEYRWFKEGEGAVLFWSSLHPNVFCLSFFQLVIQEVTILVVNLIFCGVQKKTVEFIGINNKQHCFYFFRISQAQNWTGGLTSPLLQYLNGEQKTMIFAFCCQMEE